MYVYLHNCICYCKIYYYTDIYNEIFTIKNIEFIKEVKLYTSATLYIYAYIYIYIYYTAQQQRFKYQTLDKI